MYSERVEKELKSKKIEVGDRIKVSSGARHFTGILMPRPEVGNDNILILKLDGGYNMGIRFEESTKIEKLASEKKEMPHPKIELKTEKHLPKVAIIFTGGTIGSKIEYTTGGVITTTRPEELLHDVPELNGMATFEVLNPMSVMSEDFVYKDWQRLATEVAKALNGGARGVVITQGTDTMHYTSAILSFMLQNINSPVVLTGAQRSVDRGSSDAFMNLVCAVQVAAKSDIAEVGICMHSTPSDETCDFTRGTKVRKMHTSRRDAFKPVNNRPLARITPRGEISYISEYKKSDPKKKGTVVPLTGFEPKVALIKVYPNSDPGIMDYYLGRGYKGIILEATGLGHVPTGVAGKEYSWLDHIKKAVDSGVIVGITSQTLYGRVNDSVYKNLRLVSKTGAIFCEDMLPEVAYLKLGFLLGNYKRDEAAKMLNVNVVGEITKRTEVDEFVI